jgi:catechol 2,3-dioxygenase-like lactoylglutathione lyase family enzyme
MKIHLGTVGHFGLAVSDVLASSRWWRQLFDLEVLFEGIAYAGLTNKDITIVLFTGTPHPETIEHMSFHVSSMKALRDALAWLKKHDVVVEDPGNEIGPESEGSKHMGLWFHDLDGYRWELSLQAKRSA